MKRVYQIAIMLVVAIAFTACGDKAAQNGENAEGAAAEQTTEATNEVKEGSKGPCTVSCDKFSIDIPEELMGRRVVPCSVQLLIENATKHNVVNADRPLRIRVRAEADTIVVSNTLNPKVSSGPSTGLGLKYLREQYHDVAGKEASVRMTDTEYTVQIPLI